MQRKISPHDNPIGNFRRQSYAEEIANALTHGIGLALAVAGLVALVWLAVDRGTVWHVVGCSIYGGTLVALYAASTLYHAFRHPEVKRLARVVDHVCIYLLIAGTYTPFTLTNLRGGWGWTLFGLVWGMAVVGIFFKIFFIHRFVFVSTAVYLLMGWLAVIAFKPMVESIPLGGLIWMIAGGLCYTVGVFFYARDYRPYFHTVWHLFVLAGSVCHFLAVLLYVLPD